MFLSGVFTSGSVPQAPAPAILNFSSSFSGSPLGTSFTLLAPLPNQSFYIGDGLTGTGSGTAQSFMVPDEATHFYLGIVDGGYFVGAPDFYDNNRGSFSVQGAVAVPEPATWAALVAAAGAAAVVGSHRRRRSHPPGARPMTGTKSCRPTTNATSFKRRIDEVPVIDIHSL